MSILKSKALESKVQYIATASKIYTETLAFLTRLSARYSRLIAQDTIAIAGKVMDYTQMANATFPSDEQKYTLRREYLIKAKANVVALDRRLCQVYEILMQNPQGCFNESGNKIITSDKAIRRLDKMAESLGCLIDEEIRLIEGVLASDKKRWQEKSIQKFEE